MNVFDYSILWFFGFSGNLVGKARSGLETF
jgi:hypothetical protein